MEVDPKRKQSPSEWNHQPAYLTTTSRDAYSMPITVADGLNTDGTVNRHPSRSLAYSIGVADTTGPRETMEDSYSFVVDFDDIRGQGYFGLFDGHAGKHAAEWCGQNFHEHLLDSLHSDPGLGIPSVLNKSFGSVDAQLEQLARESGCTAVVAFLRIEDGLGGQSFLTTTDTQMTDKPGACISNEGGEATSQYSSSMSEETSTPDHSQMSDMDGSSAGRSRRGTGSTIEAIPAVPFEPNWVDGDSLRRVLYVGNAGDARAVLCRGGEALRLTYDHKGSDAQEIKRILDAGGGGVVWNNRVNGVLAVTRSLGDAAMKEFVIGSPYTTETELSLHDEFLIIACDGLWDVTGDQEAVDLVCDMSDAQQMATRLVDDALAKFSSDNVTVMVVRFKPLESDSRTDYT